MSELAVELRAMELCGRTNENAVRYWYSERPLARHSVGRP